jgi:hypothetical protein
MRQTLINMPLSIARPFRWFVKAVGSLLRTMGNDTDVPSTNMTPEQPAEIYLDLRDRALSVTPEQLDLTFPDDETVVYGIVMDWHLGQGIVTLLGMQSDDASFYTSVGGGTMGGGAYENVRKAAAKLIAKGQVDLPMAKRSDDTTLPGTNSVRFYLLTNKGRFVAEEKMENFESDNSQFIGLFSVANELITELTGVMPE